jgi:hypothetical protein
MNFACAVATPRKSTILDLGDLSVLGGFILTVCSLALSAKNRVRFAAGFSLSYSARNFRSFSVYPIVTLTTRESRVTAAAAGSVTFGFDVRGARAFGRICVWPPGGIG